MSDSDEGEICDKCGETVGWGCECDDGEGSGGDDAAVEIENNYHEADGCKKENPGNALDLFKKVVEQSKDRDEDANDYAFKAQTQVCIISMNISQHDDLEANVSLMLAMSEKGVAKDDVSNSVNAILFDNSLSSLKADLQEKVSGKIIAYCKKNDEFLWFKVCLRHSWILYDQAEFKQLMVIITDMKRACKFNGVADSNNSYEAFDKSFK